MVDTYAPSTLLCQSSLILYKENYNKKNNIHLTFFQIFINLLKG